MQIYKAILFLAWLPGFHTRFDIVVVYLCHGVPQVLTFRLSHARYPRWVGVFSIKPVVVPVGVAHAGNDLFPSHLYTLMSLCLTTITLCHVS